MGCSIPQAAGNLHISSGLINVGAETFSHAFAFASHIWFTALL